jgi:hypothetical protein
MDTIILLILVIIYIILYIYVVRTISKSDKKQTITSNVKDGTCDAKTCGALDPVSNPAYNMQQIVKQSILLEEHLVNKNKRCRDCITKHFLHIIGLAEEAQMLATKNCKNYPLINENVELYNNLFERWRKTPTDSEILIICDELRNNRKKLIVIYYFDDNYNISSGSSK